MESGKLFIGGISWDTNEDRLREYFQNYGEVVEAVIMKDRATGRARGFGFVVFADPAVAERVVLEKHMIDGRSVEAKKAVPRDDQNILSKNGGGSSSHGSPGPTRTKKIFVGGLASNITESDFKKYFDRYGIITDVVVMYDHNTQRPRGFGFITYDSEESVDKVLQKNFHELNGKMVEVKRAIPKELSPGPSRGQLASYNNGLGRFSSLLNGYSQGYVSNPAVGYGVRMEDRLSPVTVSRGGNGIPHFGIVDQVSTPSFGVNGNFSSTLSFGMSPSNQWAASTRYNNYVGYGGGNGRTGPAGSVLGPTNHSLWGTEGLNPTMNIASIRENGTGNSGLSSFGGTSSIWSGGAVSAANAENLRFGNNGDMSYAPGAGIFSRNKGSIPPPALSSAKTYDGSYADLYENGPVYGDSSSPWQSPPSEEVASGPFSFGFRTAASDVINMNSASYGVVNKQSIRGIAA